MKKELGLSFVAGLGIFAGGCQEDTPKNPVAKDSGYSIGRPASNVFHIDSDSANNFDNAIGAISEDCKILSVGGVPTGYSGSEPGLWVVVEEPCDFKD